MSELDELVEWVYSNAEKLEEILVDWEAKADIDVVYAFKAAFARSFEGEDIDPVLGFAFYDIMEQCNSGMDMRVAFYTTFGKLARFYVYQQPHGN